ncbi:alpha/beta hydrolase [Lacibacterium aquatile]|uniref:Alpha/beta hydrolase n=1 Tax=Lacibacterium aquatile TaxID=1168082 RepID=A0ABW5DKH8_9PROT
MDEKNREHHLESGFTEEILRLNAVPAPLFGTYTVPRGGSGKVPAALILPGSGPVDRDGNIPGTETGCIKALAHELAHQGIASLRIDKRGVGASREAAPSEQELRLETYVADAIRWLTALREQTEVGRVYLIGHSEGALIATIAAQRIPCDGLALLAGAGRPAGEVIRSQLVSTGIEMALVRAAGVILSAMERGQTVDSVPPELNALFRPSVQPYLRSWLAVDPATELARVKVPTMVIQGDRDLQVSITDARRLVAHQRDAQLTVVHGMNHILRTVPTNRDANLASYNVPSLPISASLPPILADFMIPWRDSDTRRMMG